MKKIVLAVAALLMAATPVLAAGTARSNTGCGLGTVLWGNKADGSTMSQSLQATTNGTFGNQTFGITTGTSECTQPAKIAENERLINFVRANMDDLAKDIAQGRGESLDTFAELLQVPAEQRPAFNAKLQQNFGRVFTSSKVEMAEVIDNAVTVTN
ncbi:MAG: DUF3015 domain-containing protein [Desulfuromonadales bacterium]|nr:MAG: DUF3015 domain-containing protein [Desulfuromonadales bacterium]